MRVNAQALKEAKAVPNSERLRPPQLRESESALQKQVFTGVFFVHKVSQSFAIFDRNGYSNR
jgi:hypothetical protein